MVSNASDDFPEPDRPVKTISWSRGSRTSRSLRLCSRAPRIVRSVLAVDSATSPSYRAGARYERTFVSADGAQLAAQLGDLVAQPRRLLEPELLGGLVHLLLEALDEPAELLGWDPGEVEHRGAGGGPSPPPAPRRGGVVADVAGPDHLEDVGDLLADGLGVDAVLPVVDELALTAPVGLRDRLPHRIGHLVGVHDHLAVDVAGRPADHLDEGRLGAQEALLVGVEDRDEGHLGQVEALPEQVDADEDVELAEPQRPEDL